MKKAYLLVHKESSFNVALVLISLFKILKSVPACTHRQSSQQSESCSQAGGPHTDLRFYSSLPFLHKALHCIFLSRLSVWKYASRKVCRKEQKQLAFDQTSLDSKLQVM